MALVSSAALLGACSRPLGHARQSALDPVSVAEERAAERQGSRRCSDNWSLILPGVGQMCRGRTATGVAMLSAGAVELGTGIVVGRKYGFDHPGAALPLLAFQDAWVYANVEPYLDSALAGRALYAPPDDLTDMLAAPFNLQVLRKPEVWAGTLLSLGLGVGATLLLAGDDLDTSRAFGDPNLFGRSFERQIGYPLGTGMGVGLFSHVAIAEETLFRGLLQSSMARRHGEFQGWLVGSLAFGLTHSLNIFALPEQDRVRYLTYAVPLITVLGSYMGYAYQRTGYNLSVPVAIHFWYDLLLNTTFFIMDPENSMFSVSMTLPF